MQRLDLANMGRPARGNCYKASRGDVFGRIRGRFGESVRRSVQGEVTFEYFVGVLAESGSGYKVGLGVLAEFYRGYPDCGRKRHHRA